MEQSEDEEITVQYNIENSYFGSENSHFAMINKTRIVGNNVGEETFKIQNKWRKYKTTQ